MFKMAAGRDLGIDRTGAPFNTSLSGLKATTYVKRTLRWIGRSRSF